MEISDIKFDDVGESNFPRYSSNIKTAENKSMNDGKTKMRYFFFYSLVDYQFIIDTDPWS